MTWAANNEQNNARQTGFASRQAASIHSGSELVCCCMLLEISESGARLAVPSERSIPARFVLCLSQNGLVRRQCQVSWRAKDELGVIFEAQAHEEA